ncbi:DUF2156 domain-containing protein [Helicobacter sp. T3_23-1059]
MEFKPIALESKQILEPFLDKEDYEISDIVFGNLYIWKHARDIAYEILHDCVVIKTQYTNALPYFFYPFGNGDKIRALQDLREFLKKQNLPPRFESIESKNIDSIKSVFSGLEFIAREERFDYVYSIDELIRLEGRKFHKKKNHLNQFLQNNGERGGKWDYEKISAQNADEIMTKCKEWLDANPNKNEALEIEFIGIKNALQVYENLGLKGGAIRLGGEIVAFSFGEVMNEKMALAHIEKANPQIAGAYQIINQQLLVNEFSELELINREEDLGIEGLRRAKKSYNPIKMVEKYASKI